MLADDTPVLAQLDAVGMGAHFHRAADGAGLDRVFVVVEAHEAGLRHRGVDGVKAVEAAAIQARSLFLEHLPDRLAADLRMGLDTFARATHWSTSQSLSSSMLLTRTRGENSRARIVPAWFSTWPFSQPEAGVQATGSTR